MSTGVAELSVRTFSFGAFRFVPERQVLLRGGAPVALGGRARDLLTVLVERAGDVVDKRELIALVWPDTHVGESNLKVNMNALRRALGESPDSPTYIATVVGRGYRFVASVEVGDAGAPSHEVSAPEAHENNLPIATTHLVGRQASIEAIGNDVSEARLVSIVGPGGAGKTTLALAVAGELLGSFRHGVWLVDLARFDDPALVPNAIATAVGLVTHAVDRLTALESHLRDKELLLVFDNCEHLIEAAAVSAGRLLEGTASVRILATSREPLRLAGERVRRLSGLESPPVGAEKSAAVALTFPAVQLFAERARDRLETFSMSDADAVAASEICRRLDGLPLAIELAANYVHVLGVHRLEQHLAAKLGRFPALRGGPERHRTLHAMLDWSYRLLSARERALLRRVTVFAGSFDLDGACALSDDEPAARRTAIDDLTSLVDQSLLATEVRGDGIAYRLLVTTRAYCLEELRASEEESEVRRRHALYLCAVLERATKEWAQLPARDWARRYGGLLDDVRHALDWLKDTTNEALLVRLTVHGCLLWNHFSLTEECRIRTARGLEGLAAAHAVGTDAEMQLQMSFAGTTLFTRGALPPVMLALERVREVAVRLGDLDHHLRCLRMLSSYELFRGNPDGKAMHLRPFLHLAATADPTALPGGEAHMALAEMVLGELEPARRRLVRHYGRWVKNANDPRFVRFLFDQNVDLGNVLSQVEWLRGFPDTGRQIIRDTIEFAHTTKHPLSLSNALAVACMLNLLAGYQDECAQHTALLSDQVVRHGIIIWRPIVTFCRGALACTEGSTNVAGLTLLEQALEEFRERCHWFRMPLYLGIYAQALARGGRLAEAYATIQTAVESAHRQKERWILPEILRIQASLLAAQAQWDRAQLTLDEAMARAREVGALTLELRAANDLATHYRAHSREADVRQLLEPICNAFTEGFTTPDFQRARTLLGRKSMP